MLRNRILHATAAAVIIALTLALGSCGCGSSGKTGSVDELKAALEKDGFTVQEGKLEVLDITKMADMGLVPSCWANNPSTPYLVYKLPPAPGQTARNNVSDAPINPQNKGLWEDWKLRQDEAIIYIGKTPPPCDYYSYRSYIAGRYSLEAGRVIRVFDSLGDTLNNVTIKTGEGVGGAGQSTVIVTSADQGVSEKVHSAIESSGYSKDIINDDIISANMVNMGLEPQDDSFAFIHRTAFFKDKEAGDDYMYGEPGTLLRVTPEEPVTKLEPYDVPDLRIRGTGTTELDLLPDIAALEKAIIEKYNGQQATPLETRVWLPEGYYAIQRNEDALGENRDTTYLATDPFILSEDPDDFVIVFGVNHKAAGKATYCNFGVYGIKLNNGVGAVSNHDFTGTAEEYLPGNPNADKLYVWKVARHASGDKDCLEVPFGIGAAGIDLDTQCFIGYRAYVEPSTRVGPFWSELVLDRAIKFSPANP
ncbi:MAG: hypothetical protein JXA49_08780, partial [Actinobacteria bacterium]|nr:hypothetical protein [Actinomycetota bacterium]